MPGDAGAWSRTSPPRCVDRVSLHCRRLRHRAEQAIAVALLFAFGALVSLAGAQTVINAPISNVLAGGAVTSARRRAA